MKNYNLKENEITIHLVFARCWNGKPFLDCIEPLGYLMVVNPKKDMRRIGKLMKVARKAIEKREHQKTNFRISKVKEFPIYE